MLLEEGVEVGEECHPPSLAYPRLGWLERSVPLRRARVHGVGEAVSQFPLFALHDIRATSLLALLVRLERADEGLNDLKRWSSPQQPNRRATFLFRRCIELVAGKGRLTPLCQRPVRCVSSLFALLPGPKYRLERLWHPNDVRPP